MSRDIAQDLKDANVRGVAPPQNWTHRAIEEIERLRTALRLAREGYASEAATGLPVLPQWRERTVALIDAALGA